MTQLDLENVERKLDSSSTIEIDPVSNDVLIWLKWNEMKLDEMKLDEMKLDEMKGPIANLIR